MVLVEILLEDVVVGVYDINHLMIRRGDLMIVVHCTAVIQVASLLECSLLLSGYVWFRSAICVHLILHLLFL